DISTQKAYSSVGPKTMYQENNWVGVKMGDVNFDSDYLIRNTSRAARDVYPLQLVEYPLNDGTLRLAVQASEKIRTSGFQLALNMGENTNWAIQNAGIILKEENWVRDQNLLKISWVSKGLDQVFDENEVLFYIDFDPSQQSIERDRISLVPAIDFRSEIYTT